MKTRLLRSPDFKNLPFHSKRFVLQHGIIPPGPENYNPFLKEKVMSWENTTWTDWTTGEEKNATLKFTLKIDQSNRPVGERLHE